MSDRCYCIFEGGGAKGIAHVGALAALETADLELVGFAGTSAGAIVAALAATGHSSQDLFGAEGSILDMIDRDSSNIWSGPAHWPTRSPSKLLGRVGWSSIRTIRRLWPWCLLLVVPPLFASGLFHWFGWIGETTQLFIQLGFLVLLASAPLAIAYPPASLKGFSSGINQVLRLKIFNDRKKKLVTFADLEAANCKPLKIVAADIAKNELVLFSAETTPNVAVCDAVAASVCIPGIFKSWRIGDSRFYDGGIVSNLPAWTFDVERSVDRDCWTAVIEVSDKSKRVRPPWGYGILAAAFKTALFGSGLLNTRNVDRLRSVSLDVDLDLLQFGLSRHKASEVIAAAKGRCQAALVYQIETLPNQIEAALQQLVDDSRAVIAVARRYEGIPTPFSGELRAALHFPQRGDNISLLSEFSVGQLDHTDERIRLPRRGSLVGRALEERTSIYADKKEPALWKNYSLSRPEHRWPRKLVWSDLQWSLCIPYFHVPSSAWLVLSLDSNETLGLSDPIIMLEEIMTQVESMLDRVLPLEAFAWL